MKWLIENNKTRRTLVRFAFLPTKVYCPENKNYYTIWLGKYYKDQIYSKGANYSDTWGEWITVLKWTTL